MPTVYQNMAKIIQKIKKGQLDEKEVNPILENILIISQNKEPLIKSPVEQIKSILLYGDWLKEKNHLGFSSEDLKLLSRFNYLPPDENFLIFFAHNDPILSSFLAWEYIKDTFPNTHKSSKIRQGNIIRHEEYCHFYPQGFFLRQIPKTDCQKGIGTKFCNFTVRNVRTKIKPNQLMSFEGLQFIGITHREYIQRMNRKKVPAIDLPGLSISQDDQIKGYFYHSPYIEVTNGEICLDTANIDAKGKKFGSGSFI